MAEGEHLKMILVDNKSPHAVTLYILQNWSKSRFLSLSFIVNGGESFLFHRKTTFRFELTAPPEKKNITIWGPIMWEKDILLRVSGDDDIQVKDEEFPKEKQICLRRNYMKEEVSASGMKNLYEILGLNMKEVRKKSIEEQNEIIKKAYYSQLRRWHPDRNPGNGDKAICQKIINAYDILKDPEARAAYNNVADYDKGWCSQARWGEVFKPECYSDEQKKQYRKRMGLLILSSVLVTAGIGLTFVTAGMSGPVVLGIIAGATFRCGISSRSRELIDKAKAFKKYFISLMIGADGGAAMGAGVAEITKLLDGEAKLALKDAKLSLERQIAITMTRNVFRGFTNSVANNLDAVLADGQKITWEEFLLHVLTDALLGGIAGLRGGLTENMIEKLVSAKDVAAAFERVISSSTHNRFEVVTKIAVETFANLIEHLDDDVENNSVEDDIKNSARLAAIAVENHFTMMDNEVPKIIEDGEDITGMEAKSNEAFHDISEETCDETKNYANSTKSAARNAKETVGKDGITTTSDNEESTRDSNDVSDKFQKSNREIKQDDCGENAKGNSDKSDKTLQVYMPMPVETNVKRDFTKRTPPYEKEETNYNECTQLAGQRMTYISEGAWFSKMLVDYEEDGEEKHHEGYGSGSSILIPNNATNIKVKFQVMRTPGVWCDVKKYDHFKKCWVKPTKPHIFKYDKPVSCTYTLDGNLYFEKVTKITGEYFREMFDCGLPRYKTLVDETTNSDDFTGPVKHQLKYISEGLWLSKMLVDFQENGETKHYEIEDSESSFLLPTNATNIKVRFQVMRAPGIWCDVKKYDRFKKCWVKPIHPHIFEYDKPLSRTFTLADCEAVMKITGGDDDNTFDIDGRAQSREEFGSYDGTVKLVDNKDHISADVKVDHVIEDSQLAMLSSTLNSGIKESTPIVSDEDETHSVDSGFEERNNAFYKWFDMGAFHENGEMKKEYKEKMARFKWVQSFSIVDAYEEGNDYNLEIVCKYGEVPCNEDIVELLGEDILPCITYKKASKIGWFETNILDKNFEIKREYANGLLRLGWVKSFKIIKADRKGSKHCLEIALKFAKVPCTHDLVELFGEEVLPFITYKKASKADWFESTILDENFKLKKIFADGLSRLKWVESFKVIDANEECDKRRIKIVLNFNKVPCIADILELFGDEILPFITYEKFPKTEWFERNIFADKRPKLKKEYKDSLSSLPWIQDFYVAFDIEKDKTWKIYITAAQNEEPSMDDLKEIFGDNIYCFVDFIQEQDDDSESCFLNGPRTGHELESDVLLDGRFGTIGILGVEGEDISKHYAITCYHVCFGGELWGHLFEMHEDLKEDCDNGSPECTGISYKYTSEVGIQNLGTYARGLYNDKHDIGLIKLDQNLNCNDVVEFLKENNFWETLLSEEEVEEMFAKEVKEKGGVDVGKFGSVTKDTRGKLFSIEGMPLRNGMNNGFYRIRKAKDETAFATRGDSGALVYKICEDGKKKPFAYLSNKYKKVYHCANLKSSLEALNFSVKPCLGDCGMNVHI